MGLFKPTWMSKNQTKALASVKALKDEATLRRVVDEAPLECVRVRAAEMIDDQELYKRYARAEGNSHFGYAMAMCIDDVDFLWEFIRSNDCPPLIVSDVRKRIDKLDGERRDAENRAILAEIPSMNDIIRLIDIATSDRNNDVTSLSEHPLYGAPQPVRTEEKMRLAAVERLAELDAVDALVEVAHSKNATLSNTAEEAVAKITDQHKLYQLALDDTVGWYARAAAVDTLSDRSLLDQLAATTSPHGPLDTPIEKLAERRIQQIRSEELCHGEHDWQLIGLEFTWRGEESTYRCRRCGIESQKVFKL